MVAQLAEDKRNLQRLIATRQSPSYIETGSESSEMMQQIQEGVDIINQRRKQQQSQQLNQQQPKEQPRPPEREIVSPHMQQLINSPASSLPGGAKHPILSLSDEDFKRIPISEMMSWYGEADGDGTCSEDFGNKVPRACY